MRTYLLHDLNNFIYLTEENFWDMISKLCEINYELTEAYDAALNHLNTLKYGTILHRFKNYCQSQIILLNFLLKNNHKKMITQPSGECYLTKGKVILNHLNCEKAILSALHSNELDACYFYERTMICGDKIPEADDTLTKGLMATTHHAKWLESQVNQL